MPKIRRFRNHLKLTPCLSEENVSSCHTIFEHVFSLSWFLFAFSVNGRLRLSVEIIHSNSLPCFALLLTFQFTKHWKRSYGPCIFLTNSLTLHCPSYLDNWKFYAFMPLSKKPYKRNCLIRNADLYLFTLWLRQKGNYIFRKVELFQWEQQGDASGLHISVIQESLLIERIS